MSDSDHATVLFGIGRVRLADGRTVSAAHYRLFRDRDDGQWKASITCGELPHLESLIEHRLILELADGRQWHFTIDTDLNCVQRPPGLVTGGSTHPRP
jgi:hypothetical protein